MSRTFHKKALLLDGPEDRRLFRRFLLLHGFEIQECEGPGEALALLEGASPDLVVAGVDLAGEPALARCREREGEVAVLYHGEQVSAWEALGADRGRAAFLSRPFTLLDFHLTLQTLLKA